MPFALPLLLGLAAAAPPELRLAEGRPIRYQVELTVDPARDTLDGVIDIDLTLEKKTRLLWLNATDLEIASASLEAGGQTQAARVVPGDEQTVGFTWDRGVSGQARLHVVYEAKVSPLETQGAFAQREGEDAYVLTQLQATDARRVFPCFDQPDLKTPWRLTLHVPASLGAYSNSPALSETLGPDGFKTVAFAETRPLPSYLVAFAVGPFDVVDAGRAGRDQVPVRILTPRGRGGDAAWAAEVTGPLLEDLESWFDRPYPFEKLDIVSIPQPVGWGAMENAGLITIMQGWLLARPEDDTPERRRDYAETMAHELAHQWFGDLVTPTWWDDLWLNESFASWLATKMVLQRWPEWRYDVGRVAHQAMAMQADSLESARQVREPIRSFDDIQSAFDAITYQKGEAVLDMVERWLGPETFQRGVRLFFERHAWGNATADDFVSALSDAAGQDLSGVFESFLEQPGVPEVRYACEQGSPPRLVLQQARWLPTGATRGRWSVPVCVRYPGADGEARACTVLERRKGTLPLPGAASCPSWLVPNDGQSGYYRVAFEEAELVRLLEAPGLTVPERVGVLHDASARVARGAVSPGALLGQLPALLALDERPVTAATINVAEALDGDLVPDELQPAYQRFLRATYGPLASELGLAAGGDEDEETRLLRPKVLGLVGIAGQDADLQERARPLAERWLDERDGVDPDLVPVVLRLAGQGGGMAWFERLRAAAEAEPDRARREALFKAMGGQREPEVVAATLSWLTSGKVDLREAIPALVGFLSHPDSAAAQWAWTTEHWERLEALVPATVRAYLVLLGAGFCDEARQREVEAFFAPKVGAWIGGRRQLEQTLEGIGVCAESAERQRPGVRAFLEGWAG